MAAAGTAVGLAGTAWRGPHGMIIPALHDAANDKPIPYTPVCGSAAGVPVCLNPAYGRYLADVTAALWPVLGVVAGPARRTPARVTQVAGRYTSGEGEASPAVTIGGRPPVLRLPLDALSPLPGSVGFPGAPETVAQFADQLRLLSVYALVGAGHVPGTRAQQAVRAALLRGRRAVRRAG